MNTKEALNFLYEKSEKELLKLLSNFNIDLINKNKFFQSNQERLEEIKIGLNQKIEINEYKIKYAYYKFLKEQQELLKEDIVEIKSNINKVKEEILNKKRTNQKINDYFKEKEKQNQKVIEKREDWLNNYSVKNPYN